MTETTPVSQNQTN